MPTLTIPRLSWRTAAVLASLLLVLTTCGGARHELTTASSPTSEGEQREASGAGEATPGEAAPSDAGPTVTTARGSGQGPDVTIPDVPGAGAPADGEAAEPEEEDPQLPAEVELHEPHLLVRAPAGQSLADATGDVEGVAHAAAGRELTATTEDADGEARELQLLAVDGEAFRPLTPDVTAQAPAVWERLADGDVLVRHDVARRLGIELGGEIQLQREDQARRVRVGALAANGAPPVADVIVPLEVADALGADGLDILLVSAGQDPEAVAERLADLGEVELHERPEPEQAPAQPSGGAPVELESFTYTSRGDGTIAIHGDWAARNIVPVEIPGMGTTRCHRVMVPQLYAALQEIIDAGLYGHFKPEQFGGCWVPRHILFDPGRSLSMHAWGLAIDLNVQDNGYGAQPQMDPRIVEIFEKWGFEWGGHWSTPDGMHFELDRIVEVD